MKRDELDKKFIEYDETMKQQLNDGSFEIKLSKAFNDSIMGELADADDILGEALHAVGMLNSRNKFLETLLFGKRPSGMYYQLTLRMDGAFPGSPELDSIEISERDYYFLWMTFIKAKAQREGWA
jgi:hypothetical protein